MGMLKIVVFSIFIASNVFAINAYCASQQVATGNENIIINGSYNLLIIANNYLLKDNARLDVSANKKIVVETIAKEKIKFDGVRTEKNNQDDPRIINEYLAYCDEKNQIDRIKENLSNQFSGYPRLLALYKSFFERHKNAITFSGNIVPLTILNEELLKVLGRETDEPLKFNEVVEDNKLLSAFINAWYRKNLAA